MKLQACLRLAFFVSGIIGLLGVSMAEGALITFTFTDGSPRVDGTSTAFDTPGPAGASMTVSGLTLTSMGALAPQYSPGSGSGPHTWDGTSFIASTTNFPGSLDQLAISNPSLPGTNDSNNFNPQESWTVKFSQPIIFRSIDGRRIDSGDMMRVTFGSFTFDFTDANFDSGDDITDPFGPSLTIPANTEIKFSNSAVYPSLPLTGSDPSAGAAWGLRAFSVETVPEPSALLIAGLGFIGLGMVRRQKR
jgi:hypothetical protein